MSRTLDPLASKSEFSVRFEAVWGLRFFELRDFDLAILIGSSRMRIIVILLFLIPVIALTAWVLRPIVLGNSPSNTALVAEGQIAFEQHCSACHGVKTSGIAPGLGGLLGRQAGTTDFPSSTALRSAGFTWDAERLEAFLSDPRGLIPDNQMAFFGLEDPDERAAVVAYITSL